MPKHIIQSKLEQIQAHADSINDLLAEIKAVIDLPSPKPKQKGLSDKEIAAMLAKRKARLNRK